MRKKRKKSPIWPYLGILACLFLLSLTAPRAWDRHARRELPARTVCETPRTAPIVNRVPRLPAAPVVLECEDESELTPRAPEFDFGGPLESPPSKSEPSASIVPPAPQYAEEVREEAEVARLPTMLELPRTKPTAEEAAPEPPLPAAEPTLSLDEPEQPRPESPIQPNTDPDPQESTEAHEPAPPAIVNVWPLPRTLLEQLTNLVHEDSQLVWSRLAIQRVHELCRDSNPQSQRATLAELRAVVVHDAQVPAADPALQPQLARARYALTRWLDVWDAAVELDPLPLDVRSGATSAAKVRACLDDFEAIARRNPAGRVWREYLKLDELRGALADDASEVERRQAARAVLDRLTSPKLSPAQREFVKRGSLAALRDALRSWAVEPVAVGQVLAHLEQFEYSGLGSDAQMVAEDYRNLAWSPAEEAKSLGQHLDTHFRNANLRVAVSGELANRLVPQPERIDAPVRDTVVNVPVRGYSSTFTKLSVLFVPDNKRIRIGLEAHGVVDANTISDAGPATFRNRGQSTFLVRKLFVLGPRGLHVWPAIAEAENNFNYLVSLETDYDGVPLVGSLVRNIARSQHDEMRQQARRQTEQKVAVRALHQLDSEVDTRLAEAERKMQESQGATLRRMGLELVPISLATTEERVVARVRVASGEQLGAHTPRPRAPSDSWFSLQVHQSALNNALENLDLEGRTFELSELFTWVADKLGRPELAEQEELPEDVRITFADHDAVRLKCVEDRLEVTFSLAELKHAGSRWHDFQVRTHYAPEADGLSPRFTRIDTIHLAGESLRGKIEFKLRAIFSKVLSKNRDLRLLADSVTGDPRFKELQVTQFKLEDGWVALAYSPRRVSSNVARRPK